MRTCILLLTVLVQFIRSRRSAALRLLKGLGLGWAGYLLVVVAVAVAGAARPQRVYQRGQERCFDEMCFAVADVKTATELAGVRPRGVFYVVMVRGTSRSLGRTQKEGGLRALLWSDGRSWETSEKGRQAWQTANGPAVPLTSRLTPGESILSTQIFDVPRDVAKPALVLSHGFTPGYFVIGECPLFHKPEILLLGSS